MDLTIVDHPLAAERLATVRDERTDSAAFRRALDELATMLVYEASRGLPTVDTTVRTPLDDAPARRLVRSPLLVPVLRAGLGLLHAAQALLPDSPVAFVGVTRNEETFEPVEYVVKVPADSAGRPCFILDPMLATGGSLAYTVDVLRQRGVDGPITVVCVLAAPEGIERLRASGHDDIHVVTAAVDSHLNERKYIVPGLGDAGDRQFGAA